jgi:hypothetical protein
MENIYVVVRFEPLISRVLAKMAENHPTSVLLLDAPDDQPPTALLRCQKVEDTTYGFLRLELAVEEKSPAPGAHSIAIPAGLVACLLDSPEPLSVGFA